MTQNITGIGNGTDDFALQLGNGTLANDVTGNVTGNINLRARQSDRVLLQTGEGWARQFRLQWLLPNPANGDVDFGQRQLADVDFIDGDLGTTATDRRRPLPRLQQSRWRRLPHRRHRIHQSACVLVFATGSSLDVTGNVRNDGTGAVTLVAGWDGTTIGTGADPRCGRLVA